MLLFAWIVSLTATLGSLFFSEVMHFVPCSLCWYQRIFMYPILVILTLGLFTNDSKALKFSSPLAFFGFLVAFYHNLLMWKIIPEAASPCMAGIPCSTEYVSYLGFINIPLMSLTAFTLILVLLFVSYRKDPS